MVILALSLAGCSVGAPASTNATPTPTPSKDQSYASVTALRDAAVAAGYTCPSWEPYAADDGPRHAKEAGQCSDEDVFSIYASDSDLQDQLELSSQAGSDADLRLLVGPTWIINVAYSAHLELLQTKMGGEPWQPQPTTDPDPGSEVENATSPEDEIEKEDIALKVKIKSKKCTNYETMPDECDIEFKIDASVDSTGWPDSGELEVYYEVRGGADGPEENTLTMDLAEGSYQQDGDQYTTTRPGKKLTARVTDLEYSE